MHHARRDTLRQSPLAGVTPKAVRAQGDVNNLKLVEPIRMDETLKTRLEPPRFENRRALLLAGLP